MQHYGTHDHIGALKHVSLVVHAYFLHTTCALSVLVLVQGEDICMALQTHINDIMMKRYSKVRGHAHGVSKVGTQLLTPNVLTLQSKGSICSIRLTACGAAKNVRQSFDALDMPWRAVCNT